MRLNADGSERTSVSMMGKTEAVLISDLVALLPMKQANFSRSPRIERSWVNSSEFTTG